MSVIKRWNDLTGEWEVAVVGKQGPVGPTGATGPSGPAGSITTATVFDSKGDLVVGIGDNSADRLAAGSSTQSLVVSPSTSTGLGYAHRSGSGGMVAPLAGRVYPRGFGGASFAAGSSGVAYGTPLQAVAGASIQSISITVGTAQAGATIRYGLYGSDSVGLPAANLILTGTFDASTTGDKIVSSTFVCPSPFLWLYVCATAAGATWAITGYNNNTSPIFNNVQEDYNLGNNAAGVSISENCASAFPASPTFNNYNPGWGQQPGWRYRFA